MANRPDEPRFTVVVPTRERCDTLEATLRTCVMQDYDGLDILVSDNFSQDDTAAVVAGFRDPRVRYVNTGRRVAMSANYEFALSHIAGGYVLFIGDDDALLPGAIADLAAIVREFRCEAVTWRHARYGWPGCVGEDARNELIVPLPGPPRALQTRPVLDAVARFREHFLALPGIYHACTSYEAVCAALGTAGRRIHSLNPDVYTNIALGLTLERHCHLPGPLTVNAISHHSIGASFGRHGTTGGAARQFLEEKPIPYHPQVALYSCPYVCAAESLLQARDHVPAAAGFEVDFIALMAASIGAASIAPPDKYARAADGVRAIGRANGLEEVAERLVAENPNQPLALATDVYGIHVRKRHFRLNAAEFAVRDVHAAALLAKHTLVLYAEGHLTLRGAARSTWRLSRHKLARKLPWRARKARAGAGEALNP